MFYTKKYQCFKCKNRQFEFQPCQKCGSDIFLLVCEEFEYGPGDSAGFTSSGSEKLEAVEKLDFDDTIGFTSALPEDIEYNNNNNPLRKK